MSRHSEKRGGKRGYAQRGRNTHSGRHLRTAVTERRHSQGVVTHKNRQSHGVGNWRGQTLWVAGSRHSVIHREQALTGADTQWRWVLMGIDTHWGRVLTGMSTHRGQVLRWGKHSGKDTLWEKALMGAGTHWR